MMSIHSMLRPFVKASKKPTSSSDSASTSTHTATLVNGSILRLPSYLPIRAPKPYLNSLVSLPQTRPKISIGVPDTRPLALPIYCGEPPLPEAKMKFDEAVKWLRFAEQLPLKELDMLRHSMDGIEDDHELVKSTSHVAGNTLVGCKPTGGKTENLLYTCGSKLCSTLHPNDINKTHNIKANINDSKQTSHHSEDYLASASRYSSSSSSSSSSPPTFTYTPLPRPRFLQTSISSFSSSSSSTPSFNSTPLPRTNTTNATPFTSPIAFPILLFQHIDPSPSHNPISIPYSYSPVLSTSSIYSSGPSSTASENSHPSYTPLEYPEIDGISSRVGSQDSYSSFYALPHYSDVEDNASYNEPYVRRGESCGSRASGSVRRPGRGVVVVGDEEGGMVGIGVERMEDGWGGEVTGSMEGWSGGMWEVDELEIG